MLGADLMAAAVERHGVRTVFGLPGHLESFFGALDRRGMLFRLTPKGRRLYEGVLARAQTKQETVAEVIGPANYALVSDCLDALISHYGAPGAAVLASA